MPDAECYLYDFPRSRTYVATEVDTGLWRVRYMGLTAHGTRHIVTTDGMEAIAVVKRELERREAP